MLTFLIISSGGGVAGLMAALALCKLSEERKDIKVDIYEAYPNVTEIGAGIAFWLRPWRVIRKLGLEKSLETLLEQPITDFPPRTYSKETTLACCLHCHQSALLNAGRAIRREVSPSMSS